MAKETNNIKAVRMGLRSAIKRTKRRAVKKAAMDASAGTPPATPPAMPSPRHTIVSYLRSKKKKKPPTQPTVNIMATTTTPGLNAAAAPTLKSEVNEDFKPKFNDIKELIKNSPRLAVSCLPMEALQKDGLQQLGDMSQTPGAGKAVAAGVDQGKASSAAASMRGAFGGSNQPETPSAPIVTKGAFGKAAMKPAGAAKMPSMAPKAPAAGTPKAPKSPNAQMAPKKPKGMAGPTMGKEEMGKGAKTPFDQHDIGVQPNTKLKGISNAGLELRYGNKAGAVQEHKETLKEMKKMPKPKLGKEEKGKEIKRLDGPQVSAGGGKNFPVKEHKESGKEGLNIVTPPNGTKKGEKCAYKPSAMIKEELSKEWTPKFKKDDPAPESKTDDGSDDFVPATQPTPICGTN